MRHFVEEEEEKIWEGGRIELRDSQIGGQATRQGGLGSIFRQKLGDATLGGQDGEMVQWDTINHIVWDSSKFDKGSLIPYPLELAFLTKQAQKLVQVDALETLCNTL